MLPVMLHPLKNSLLTLVFTLDFIAVRCQVTENYGGETQVGDEIFPNYHERIAMTIVNIARMAPREYPYHYTRVQGETNGIGTSFPLGLANEPSPVLQNKTAYPVRPPYYYHLQANQAARLITNDRADDCGASSHTMCDGSGITARLEMVGYCAPGGSAEGAAGGTPWSSINGLLCDWPKGDPVLGCCCCPDHGYLDGIKVNCGDGHRGGLMSTRFIMGVGATNTSSADRIDGNKMNFHFINDCGEDMREYYANVLIPAGSHMWPYRDYPDERENTTRFVASYYDAKDKTGQPQEHYVIINGVAYEMDLDIGDAGAGTYILNQPLHDFSGLQECREYYFLFTSTSGTSFRYPEVGVLLTSYEQFSCRDFYKTTSNFDEPEDLGSQEQSDEGGGERVGQISSLVLQLWHAVILCLVLVM